MRWLSRAGSGEQPTTAHVGRERAKRIASSVSAATTLRVLERARTAGYSSPGSASSSIGTCSAACTEHR
jgi:hypothetical protein